jgi:hypothetical protein
MSLKRWFWYRGKESYKLSESVRHWAVYKADICGMNIDSYQPGAHSSFPFPHTQIGHQDLSIYRLILRTAAIEVWLQ